VLSKDGEHFGEIISSGSQVVGAGSIHPDTGTPYVVDRDVEITEISRMKYLPVSRIIFHLKMVMVSLIS
jgi:hypothetical protein